MGEYTAEVLWERGEQEFVDGRYSRRHLLRFDGGIDVPGSASPRIVPPPGADPAAVDPEEAFVASLSACHMLWFLAIAAKYGFRVDRYFDMPVGRLGRDGDGRMAMTLVTLRPEVRFSGEKRPAPQEIRHMHHEAHDACFIANSVKTEVRCDPVHVAD
ncbi:MAG TPA: OsmC family protein [Gammaproteobacteria bacterium]|nr:OsmC family protein [Gammaproteobacteria bacterium]